MSEIRLTPERRLLVCDVCLTYIDDREPIPPAWQQLAPGKRGGPDRCPDCAAPRQEKKSWSGFSSLHAELIARGSEVSAPSLVAPGRAKPAHGAGFDSADERT